MGKKSQNDSDKMAGEEANGGKHYGGLGSLKMGSGCKDAIIFLKKIQDYERRENVKRTEFCCLN